MYAYQWQWIGTYWRDGELVSDWSRGKVTVTKAGREPPVERVCPLDTHSYDCACPPCAYEAEFNEF